MTALAPDIAEAILGMEAVDGREPVVEREVRPLLRLPDWSAQRRAWRSRTGR